MRRALEAAGVIFIDENGDAGPGVGLRKRRQFSDFVLGQAMAAAERVINAHEKITLSAADWEIFYNALVDPRAPTKKLKAAVRRYRERVGG
jgi:uncharacterized protein (DUF1778 family)